MLLAEYPGPEYRGETYAFTQPSFSQLLVI